MKVSLSPDITLSGPQPVVFPVTPSVTTGPIPEFYGKVDIVKVLGRIHLLIHDSTVKEVLPLLYMSFTNFQAIR